MAHLPQDALVSPMLRYPWHKFGNFKYLVLLPLALDSANVNIYGGQVPLSFSTHLLILCCSRYMIQLAFQMLSRMLFIVKKYLIGSQERLGFEQVDREWDWDNSLLLQILMVYTINAFLPFINNLDPSRNSKGLLIVMLLHVCLVEPLYYWIHRAFHTHNFFACYHSLHHLSVTTEPSTAGTGALIEQLITSTVLMLPVLGASVVGYGSIGNLYAYFLVYETFRNYGHCNAEIVPLRPFQLFPFLRYVLYTPSYHSLHHQNLNSNFCLFMPLFDYLGSTIDSRTIKVHEELRRGLARNERVPDFAFLLHVADITSSMHSPFSNRGFSSLPYSPRWWLILSWPVAFLSMIAMWIWGRHFTVWHYFLRDHFIQVRCVPCYGFQYFLPFCANRINKHIEEAILDADQAGIKVISLAALNKNEALNGGGVLFVEKHKNLRVRVAHGNTLTAALIINELPKDVKEVFLTGATSKLGRAIALYLCRKGIRVMMLTPSRNRFDSIASEAAPKCRKNLVHVTKYLAGKQCKTWIVGKWLHRSEQKLAAPGTHFHQFVFPSITPLRSDCTYGKLAAIRLPSDVKGLYGCEYTLDRNVVHACHAGGLVHSLEGWTHHEVGAIDVDRIDIVWQAALKHGLTPVVV